MATSGTKRPRERNHDPPAAASSSSIPKKELLKLQDHHRSELVLKHKFLKPLFTREHKIKNLPWDPRYEKYVIQAGLYGVHKIGHIPTDHALISALVERWRQETHTFHFPIGEMTITLEDAQILLGLRVDGDPLCLPTNCDWAEEVESLLGKRVDKMTFRRRSKVAINISWLRKHFAHCPENANIATEKQYARAYLLMLVGSLLFTDHSGDSISAIYLPLFRNFERAGRYSWASGVLAFLYRELCLASKSDRMQFGGSVLLLQLWSWERLPMGRPDNRKKLKDLGGDDPIRRPPLGYGWSGYHQFVDHVTCRVQDSYRLEIDALNDGKVKWQPYEEKMNLLPPICREHSELWRTTAPLIHFWIVEMYNPGRVARQFGLCQQIPPVELHDTIDEGLHDLKNGFGKNWRMVHRKYLLHWQARWDKCLVDQTPYNPSEHDEYMAWFAGAANLYLQSPGGVPNTYSSANSIRQIATSIVEKFKDVADEEVRVFARDVLLKCKAAIKDLLEPTNDDEIFAALDNEQIPQQQNAMPVHGDDPGPSSRPAEEVNPQG